MRKQKTVFIAIVVVLIMIAFIVGGVLAQGDITGSGEGGDVVSPDYSTDESVPSSVTSAVNSVDYSTLDGMPSAAVEYSADESELHLTSADPMAAGSGTKTTLQDYAPEPLPGVDSVLNPNTITPSLLPWNISLRFVGSALKPRENDVNYTTSGSGGCVYATSGDAATVWNLPLALPEGAEVQWLRIYYYDNNASFDMGGWFTKYDLYGSLINEWYVHSVDGGNGYRDVAITPAEIIDYSNYSYVINWRPVGTGSNLQLCGFRVFYYYPKYGYNFIPWINKP